MVSVLMTDIAWTDTTVVALQESLSSNTMDIGQEANELNRGGRVRRERNIT